MPTSLPKEAVAATSTADSDANDNNAGKRNDDEHEVGASKSCTGKNKKDVIGRDRDLETMVKQNEETAGGDIAVPAGDVGIGIVSSSAASATSSNDSNYGSTPRRASIDSDKG